MTFPYLFSTKRAWHHLISQIRTSRWQKTKMLLSQVLILWTTRSKIYYLIFGQDEFANVRNCLFPENGTVKSHLPKITQQWSTLDGACQHTMRNVCHFVTTSFSSKAFEIWFKRKLNSGHFTATDIYIYTYIYIWKDKDFLYPKSLSLAFHSTLSHFKSSSLIFSKLLQNIY